MKGKEKVTKSARNVSILRCKPDPCVDRIYHKAFPTVVPYVGTSSTLCHLLYEPRPHCCLRLDKHCEHTVSQQAFDYAWKTKALIVVSDRASSGIYNMLVPLRAHCRDAHRLNPIVLMLTVE